MDERLYVLAVPKFRARQLTSDNDLELARWCRLDALPGRATRFMEAAQPGDWVVRPAEWDGERAGGFIYTPEELASQFDER